MALSAGQVSLAVKPDTSKFGGQLKEGVGKATKGVGEHMGGIIKDGLKTMAGPIAAVTAAFGAKELIQGSIDQFEKLAGQVKTIQRVTGGTIEQVSGLRGAMQLAGVDVSNINGVMMRFSMNLSKAGKDAKSTAAMNQVFGTSIKDAHGNIRPMAELLPSLADRFKAMPDGANKTALAMQLFGRQGASLIPVLNKGSDGINELTAKAKQMGLTLDDAGMKKFAESKKATREWQATLQGLQVTMGEAFLPVMETLANVVRDNLIPVIAKVREWFKQNQKTFEDIASTLKANLFPAINMVVEIFKTLVGWLVQNRKFVMGLVVAVGAGILAFKAYQMITIGITIAQKAWQTALLIGKLITGQATLSQLGFNAALLANPIALVVAAVAALVAGLIWFFTQTKTGQKIWAGFTKFLGDSMKNVGKFFADVWHGISDSFTSVFDFIAGAFKGYVNIWIGLINLIIGGLDTISVKIPDWVPGLGGQTWGLNIPKIPALAEGGVVPATPGGRLVRVAEAGQAEAVIPLSKLEGLSGASRPIMADGIGLIGWMKKTAQGESRIVFNTEIDRVMRGAR